ncbi:MAG TPA: PIG-L deacetylase family protein [Gemmataceae bacterium]|nr:PIG-L deacetylase family protein [Gemmataceae bacterium]
MPPLRILVLGAHPDDADYKAGGTAARWRRLGHEVKLVSVTNGGAGHHILRGEALVARRRAEAQAAAAVIGATYDVLDHPDGALLPSLEARQQLIRLIREFKPDLLLTHRPNDYHPDHRYTSVLVQDAAYLLTVPAICPDTPHLERDPVILYLSDDFKKPIPFSADVVVDIGPQMDALIDMLHCHASQFYEWLPYNHGHADQVPDGDAVRREWLKDAMQRRIRPLADRYRDRVVQTYGVEQGHKIEYIEAFEVCEYGSPLDEAARVRLFPFLPSVAPLGDAAPVADWSDLRDDE